jgi:hypothetical protein
MWLRDGGASSLRRRWGGTNLGASIGTAKGDIQLLVARSLHLPRLAPAESWVASWNEGAFEHPALRGKTGAM